MNATPESPVPVAEPASMMTPQEIVHELDKYIVGQGEAKRAVAFTTMLPSVTWPSPPMATRSPRRTERMVVPWNWGDSWFMGKL